MKLILETDFSDGLPLSDDELEKYRVECVERLIKNNGKYTSCSCGNMFTMATRGSNGSIEVIQTNNYKEYVYEH